MVVALKNIPTPSQTVVRPPLDVADGDWYRYWQDLGIVVRALIAADLTQGGPGSGAIQGLTLTNSAGDVVNDITVSLGGAVDSTGNISLIMPSVLTKQLDAAWAAGDNAGGRMSAAAIADTTYHTFIICKADGSGVDIGFDVSPTAPTLPADYTYFRRIGSFFRLAGAIVLFRQRGDEFLLATPVQDVNANNPGVAAVTVACSVPTGVNFIILAGCRVIDLTLAAATNALFQSTATANTAPAVNVFDIRLEGNPIAWGEIYKPIRSNLSSGFRYRLDQSTVDHFVSIVTFGWIDARETIMVYVQRNAGGAVCGVFAWPQPDIPEEVLADDDPEVIAFLAKPALTTLTRTNREAQLNRQMDAAAARGDAAAVLNISRKLQEL